MNMPKNNNIEAIYPLTPLQKGMIFHSLLSPNSGVYVLQDTLAIESMLDRESFWQAWQMLIDRHSILRTLFVRMDTDKPLQVVLKTLHLARQELDWRSLSLSEQNEQLVQLQNELWTAGFDFAKPPLLKLVLIQTGNSSFKVVWTLHHVLTDGWSSQVILKDWFALYYALRDKTPIDLPVAKPFKEYISWLNNQDFDRSKVFWESYLKGFSIKNKLVDYIGTSEYSDESSYHIGNYLTESESRNLELYASNAGITLNTLVQGAWAFLLHVYCNSDDVCFGVTVSGRPAGIRNVEKMAGPFINSVPVRIFINPDEKIDTWLKSIYRHQLMRVDYEHAPLFEIQKFSDMDPGVSLFDTLLVFDNYPKESESKYGAGAGRIDSIKIERINGKSYNHYPLTLMIAPGKNIYISFKYNEQAFSENFVNKIHQHFISVLAQIAENKASDVSDLKVYSEQDEVLFGSLKNKMPAIEDSSFIDMFEYYAKAFPENYALYYKGRGYTYDEINTKSNQLARYMIGAGVCNESRVGIYIDNPQQIIISILATNKAGATFCILDEKWPESRLAYAIKSADFSMLLTEQRKLDSFGDIDVNIISLDRDGDEIEEELTENIVHQFLHKKDYSSYMVFTSGSTGNPKPVLVGHRALRHYISGLLNKTGFNENKEWAAFASPSADLGYTAIFGALSSGGVLRLFDQEDYLDAYVLAKSLSERPIDILKIVPSHLSALLNNKGSPILPRELLILGGDIISPALIDEIKRRSPYLKVLNHYGPTETTVGVATYSVPDLTESSTDIPIGTPLAHRNIYILDKHLNPVGAGIVGDIYIGGEGLAYGYLGNPQETASKFLPDISGGEGGRMYKTGDRGYYLLDGNIFFKGREDFQIKRNGFRVELGEIESVLLRCESVCNVAVLNKNEKLCAYIVLNDSSCDFEKVKQYSYEHLVEVMQPNIWFLLDEMPLSVNGKVDRNYLKKLKIEKTVSSKTHEPESEMEKKIKEIWISLIGISNIDVNDNFYQVGGNSLLIIRLQGEINRKFDVSLEVVELFSNSTIRSQAKLLGGEQTNSAFDQLNSSHKIKKAGRDNRRKSFTEKIA